MVLLPGFQKGRDIKASARKRAGSSFGQKRAICVVQGKTDRISLLLGSIKCFPLSFNTFKRDFRWLPDGEITNKFKQIFFKGQGAPWEVKGQKGAP
jgi:hypothetical protein